MGFAVFVKRGLVTRLEAPAPHIPEPRSLAKRAANVGHLESSTGSNSLQDLAKQVFITIRWRRLRT